MSDTDRPLISCIVPAYNAEPYIAEALDSILSQTYQPIEVIVADDGSEDGTEQVVRDYGDRVRFITQTTSSPAATRNFGAEHARGEYLAFLDADDLWHHEKLARQMAAFDADPRLDLCVTHVQMFWADELKQEAEGYREHPRSRPVPGYATISLLVRRGVLERVGPFNTELWYSDATDWFLRAQEMGFKLLEMPDVLVYHRMHRKNLTRRGKQASREEYLNIVKASLDRRRQTGTTTPPAS